MAELNILQELEERGFKVAVDGASLSLSYPKDIPPALIEEAKEKLRQHKQEVLLRLKGYRLKYTGDSASGQELEEIATSVESEGYVLLWSRVLGDLVAFYRDEADRKKIPPGFVPYSVVELQELLGEGNQFPSKQSLKLIHETKKEGGRVITENGGQSDGQ